MCPLGISITSAGNFPSVRLSLPLAVLSTISILSRLETTSVPVTGEGSNQGRPSRRRCMPAYVSAPSTFSV